MHQFGVFCTSVCPALVAQIPRLTCQRRQHLILSSHLMKFVAKFVFNCCLVILYSSCYCDVCYLICDTSLLCITFLMTIFVYYCISGPFDGLTLPQQPRCSVVCMYVCMREFITR